MISSILADRIVKVSDDLHEVHAGAIAYDVHCCGVPEVPTTSVASVRVYLHTHYLEARPVLYGFPSRRDREAFRFLLTAKGVGPVAAMRVLHAMGVAGALACLDSGDLAPIARVKGIGPKAVKALSELKKPRQVEALRLPGV